MRLPGIPSLRPCSGDVWTASTYITACTTAVLEALTNPQLIAEWAPIGFDVEELDGDRLRSGSHARVNGSIAGVGASFEVHVRHADSDGLDLVARGPVALEVHYNLIERGQGVVVKATVALLAQGGVTGQLMRAATAALLSGGALAGALDRLANGVVDEYDADLVAA